MMMETYYDYYYGGYYYGDYYDLHDYCMSYYIENWSCDDEGRSGYYDDTWVSYDEIASELMSMHYGYYGEHIDIGCDYESCCVHYDGETACYDWEEAAYYVCAYHVEMYYDYYYY